MSEPTLPTHQEAILLGIRAIWAENPTWDFTEILDRAYVSKHNSDYEVRGALEWLHFKTRGDSECLEGTPERPAPDPLGLVGMGLRLSGPSRRPRVRRS